MRRRSFSGAEVTPMAAEQSNTSLMVGDEAILKLDRRLGEGISPDQEIGHHLNEKGFANAASLLGSVEYWRRGSEPTTLVVIHELVPNEGDAWALTLDRLAGFYEKVLTLSDETPERSLFPKETRSFDAEEVPAGFYDLAGQYLSLAELLGQRTAEMHAALADSVEPSFQPETFTRLYQRSLYQSLQSELRRTMRALRSRRGQLPDDVLERFDALDEEQLQARLDAVRSSRIVAERTRVHGDYHLGQVLWDGEDFVIIDFEGEPSRSVGQRRLKQSPLRDVAGMLRSFEYATHVGMNELVARGHVENVETARIRLGPWATLWRDWVTGRYMTGYLTAAVDHTFVPGDPSDLRLLLDAFLLEKACYEVRYELDHRPDWVGIPLEALRELAETFSPTGGGD